MYIPSHFKIDDLSKLYSFLAAHSFATVISLHQERPFATHIPLLLHPEEHCLYGHFAKSNSQWTDIEGQEVLVIFQGPHCYISPSWYDTPAAVPTWNYTAVHVYGNIELLHEDAAILGLLQEQTLKYEEEGSSYNLENVDPQFVAGMSKGIQAFKLRIASIEGKAKLSQNHSAERQERIIQALERKGGAPEREIAALMRENLRPERTK